MLDCKEKSRAAQGLNFLWGKNLSCEEAAEFRRGEVLAVSPSSSQFPHPRMGGSLRRPFSLRCCKQVSQPLWELISLLPKKRDVRKIHFQPTAALTRLELKKHSQGKQNKKAHNSLPHWPSSWNKYERQWVCSQSLNEVQTTSGKILFSCPSVH